MRNAFEDAFEVLEYLIVPEPDDLPALPLKGGGPGDVLRRVLVVLAAVHFYEELGGMAGEIGDSAADRLLEGEFAAGKAAIAQTSPEALFGFGGIAA